MKPAPVVAGAVLTPAAAALLPATAGAIRFVNASDRTMTFPI